jgi:energy-coupling factor transporter ATP-binding protein EcfA2
MHLRIRNVLGLEYVDINLDGQVLVGGLNGSGKTSLLQCVAAAALMDWKMRGVTQKRDTSRLTRDGSDTGSILLEYPRGSVRISYPGGIIDQQGEPPTLGSALGIGAARWMRLDEKQRAKEMAERFNTAPTREDFNAWFVTHSAAQLDPNSDAANALWDDIRTSGWDAIAKRVDSACKMLTGQWRERTGQAWGSSVRLTWAPAGLHRGEEYDLAAAQKEVEAAQEALTQALAKATIEAEMRRIIEQEAAKLPAAREALAAAKAAYDEAQAAADAATAELEKHPEPTDPRKFPQCPECLKPLAIVRTAKGGLTLEKPARKELSIQAYNDALAIRAALVAAHKQCTDALIPAMKKRTEAEVALQSAMAAEEKLQQIRDLPEPDHETILAARNRLTAAEERCKAIQTLQRAVAINEEWERGRAILEALEPSGIRAAVMERKMADINVQLGAIAERCGMLEVSITTSGALRYAGRDYDMLSESEQMRADLAMGILLAVKEGAKLFLVDRLDLLHPQAREPVFRTLAASGMTVLVAMMAREGKPPALPDLAAHKLGRSLWLGAGKLIEPGGA